MNRQPGLTRRRGPTKSQLKSRWHEIDPDTATVIRRVREHMIAHGKDVAKLAQQCGIPRTAMYQALSPLRAGRGPMRITFVRTLARACGLSLHNLLDP
jgi:DNA-binding phage protein